MTRNDFRGAFASDPPYPELAPLQTYLRLVDFQESTARRGGDWMRKLPDSTPFLRFFALELFNWPESAVYMDDMWISRCLERRGVEKYFIPASNRMGIAQ